jgi:hypothetical protein
MTARFGHVIGWTGNIVALLLVGYAIYVFLFVVVGVGAGIHPTKLHIAGIPIPVWVSADFLALTRAEQDAAVDRISSSANLSAFYIVLGIVAFIVGRAARYVLSGGRFYSLRS